MRHRTHKSLSLHFGSWYVLIARRHVHLLMGAALVVFVLAFASAMTRASERGDQTPTRTTRDKVYTKDQAAKGAAQFGTVCAPCHDPEKKTADKMPGPPLIGKDSKFVENWKDHTIGEIYTTILTTMPNDGSVVLTEGDTVNLVAHLLQSNGYPDGTDPLKFDGPSKAIQIVSVK
jgi:mono/diheme cytochrome c family protein